MMQGRNLAGGPRRVVSVSTTTTTKADRSRVVAVASTWSDGVVATVTTTFDRFGKQVGQSSGRVGAPASGKAQPKGGKAARPAAGGKARASTKCGLSDKEMKAAFAE